jgi:hypothetical protein
VARVLLDAGAHPRARRATATATDALADLLVDHGARP